MLHKYILHLSTFIGKAVNFMSKDRKIMIYENMHTYNFIAQLKMNIIRDNSFCYLFLFLKNITTLLNCGIYPD